MTQVYGLNKEAEKFLAENVAVEDIKCPHCGGVIGHREAKEKYGELKSEGMFDDGPDIYRYRLKDGHDVFEVHQATVWSSGPCIFLQLEDANGMKMFPWAEKEIQNA